MRLTRSWSQAATASIFPASMSASSRSHSGRPLPLLRAAVVVDVDVGDLPSLQLAQGRGVFALAVDAFALVLGVG